MSTNRHADHEPDMNVYAALIGERPQIVPDGAGFKRSWSDDARRLLRAGAERHSPRFGAMLRLASQRIVEAKRRLVG